MSLYGAVPLMIAHSTSRTVGLLWLNPSETWIDIESSNTGFSGEVSDVDIAADNHDIPLDSIWLDIEYTDGRSKKYFTWDQVTFGDAKSMVGAGRAPLHGLTI
ncbi:unnamed protein product [Sphagnum jensenii]